MQLERIIASSYYQFLKNLIALLIKCCTATSLYWVPHMRRIGNPVKSRSCPRNCEGCISQPLATAKAGRRCELALSQETCPSHVQIQARNLRGWRFLVDLQNKQVWLISIRPIVPTSRLPVFVILQIKVTHLRILVTGGVKSGKSRLAEKLALSIVATELPIYLNNCWCSK